MKRFEGSPIADSTLTTQACHIKDEKVKTALKERNLRCRIDVRVQTFANAWIQ